MIIDDSLCTACGQCSLFCSLGAISRTKNCDFFSINQDICVECETCRRSQACDSGALKHVNLEWPRLVRSLMSNPLLLHEQTCVPGRGTEGMKTNDVTGRYGPGKIGVSIELGRPGISVSFEEVNKITTVCGLHGVRFEPYNPLTKLMDNPESGTIVTEILKERALSVLVEFEVEQENLLPLLKSLKAVSKKVKTVFSLGLTQLLGPKEKIPLLENLSSGEFSIYPNGKLNLGLGRPLWDYFSTENE